MTPPDKEVNKKTAVNVQGQNKLNGKFGKIAKEQTLCLYFRPLQTHRNERSKLTYRKIRYFDKLAHITHHNLMPIANLVENSV